MICGIDGNGLREEIDSLVVIFGRESLVSEIFQGVGLGCTLANDLQHNQSSRTSDMGEFVGQDVVKRTRGQVWKQAFSIQQTIILENATTITFP